MSRVEDNASDPMNGGTTRAGLISPKGGAVIGPFGGTELYANAGDGFHSNDACGATITVDPSTGQLARRVTPLVRARGAEVGARAVAIPHVQTSVAVWALDLASELVFADDAGTTDASRRSRRYGVEWTTCYSPRGWPARASTAFATPSAAFGCDTSDPDIHFHPVAPRTARISLVLGF